MRESEERESATSKGVQGDGVDRSISPLPPEFVAMIGGASPEVVGRMLHAHRQLTAPLMSVVQHIRGNAFAQQALALASTHPLQKPEATDHPAPVAAPSHDGSATAQAPAGDPEMAKILERRKTAGWDQLATATPDERATPEHIRLPPNIVQALETAWQDSLKTKKETEQGGNLVHRYRGGYEVRRKPNDNPGEFDQDDKDVGLGQTLVGQVHTHPYREERDKVPEQFASFSDGDFDSLMRSDAHLSLLRSGPYTFMVAKTKQFEAMVDRLDNQEAKLFELAHQMTTVYDKAVDATKSSFSEKIEAGVMAVCEQFHLVYYEGQGGELSRKTKRPTA